MFEAIRDIQARAGGTVRRARPFAWLLLLWFLGCAGGIPKVPDDPEAILRKGDEYFQRRKYFESEELYKGFLSKHPGHERSDYAQFMLAESYYEDGDYALAAVEYRVLVTNYGYSEYVDDGYLKEALCLHKQAPKPPLDQTKNYEALAKLERFVRVFSKSPLVEEAQRCIEKIKQTLAEKDLSNAMFYVRTKRYASALIYLDKVIEKYPNNDHWAAALYEKAKILVLRGERDEAIRLLSEVIAYPKDIEVKAEAQRILHELQNG